MTFSSTNSVEDEKDLVILTESHLLERVTFSKGTICEVLESGDSESYLKRVEDEVTLYVPNYKFESYEL